MLYGCESWVLTEMLRAKFEAFHNHRCVRAMCGVTRPRTCVRSLSGGHEALRQRLGIPSMQLLISTRKLRWAGHVARMDVERLPCNFSSSEYRDHKRPQENYYSETTRAASPSPGLTRTLLYLE